jgi:hypothetical protein
MALVSRRLQSVGPRSDIINPLTPDTRVPGQANEHGVLHFKLKCDTPLKRGELQETKGDEGMQ